MSELGNRKRNSRHRRKQNKVAQHSAQRSSEDEVMPRPFDASRKATTSSLESIHIPPRTPRSARANGTVEDEVELSLLSEDQRRAANMDETDDPDTEDEKPFRRPDPSKDRTAMVLLVVLCSLSSRFAFVTYGQCTHRLLHACIDLIQGVPVRFIYLHPSMLPRTESHSP